MYDTWNLRNIYTDFDDPRFEADVSELRQKIAAFSAFADTLSTRDPLAGLKEGITLQEQITSLGQKLAMYASLRQFANSRDTRAQSQAGRIMGIFSTMAAPEAAFQAWAAGLPALMELVESDELLNKLFEMFMENEEKRKKSRKK